MAVCTIAVHRVLITLDELDVEAGKRCLASVSAETGNHVTAQDLSLDICRKVAEILNRDQNFQLDGYKDHCIRRRIAARVRASGFSSAAEYIAVLGESQEEQKRLLAALSIHVSQFFRNPGVYEAIEQRVLPDLLRSLCRNEAVLRLWSIGCANGEEPYSLAILCERAGLRTAKRISIVATDVSSEALNRARKGIYPAERMTHIPPAEKRQYFTQEGPSYQLKREVRKKVQFFRHDILADQPFYRAELILCRNLLIYFSREQQQKVIAKLHQALLPGGYLVLGRSETLPTPCRKLFRSVDPAERIYQRCDGERDSLINK